MVFQNEININIFFFSFFGFLDIVKLQKYNTIKHEVLYNLTIIRSVFADTELVT